MPGPAGYGQPMQNGKKEDSLSGVRLWIGIMLGMILLIVAVGGVTRLTHSGLSMVTWEPVLGVWPPMSEEGWQFRFDQYRAFPEYQQLRAGMSLEEFKIIFFWEYLHRMLGRLLGLAYLIPLAVFWFRGQVSGSLKALLLIGLGLLGGQGFMGWYMVKSGLVDNPFVSHYRLAAHLGLAFFLFAYLLWVLLRITPGAAPPGPASAAARRWAMGLSLLLVAQIIWGAFVAGLKAGFIYNTFPTMQGHWIAPYWNQLHPAWINVFDNPVLVQFLHRTMGILITVLAMAGWWVLRRDATLTGVRKTALSAFTLGLFVQFWLGVATLVFMVPLALGVMHQVTACVLTGCAVWMVYVFRGEGDRLHA